MSKYFKPSLLFFFLFLLSLTSFGQVVSPPKWNIQLANTDLKVGGEAEIVLKASIPRNWYIYSNDFDENAGPVLTSLSLEGSKGISASEKLKPINPKKKFDEVWEADITYFSIAAEFRQKIKITEPNVDIKGTVEYQMCSDVTGQCILYEEDFTIKAIAIGTSISSDAPAESTSESKAVEEVKSDTTLTEVGTVQESINESSPVQERSFVDLESESDKGGLLGFMFVAFLAGLAALLTPCVFPMIPMNVRFFTKRSKTKAEGIKNALIYSLFIIIWYCFIKR